MTPSLWRWIPPFGAHGQVAAGIRSTGRWRGRPKNQDAYPIYPCRDGYVRFCVMAPRQWRGLRRWLGEPEDFQDPKYDVIGARLAAWPQISVLVAKLCAEKTMKELVAAGQALGVPITAVLTPSRILASEHFQAVGAITDAELVPGVRTGVPTGYFVVDGKRAGFRTPAPAAGQDEPRWLADPAPVPPPSGRVGGYPFEGLRILDLGIIVAGGELSRLFGDLGAEVIKVESADHPDGLRQTRVGDAMSESFAWTHRNHLALGLDLRNSEGKAIFGRLVAESDAVFANFKPGTLTSLGFSYDVLHAFNPRIVLAGSSAFGNRGPWSTRMGYGPLVRAATGVTRVWTSDEAQPDNSRHPFYDATTIFPDHVVGRVGALLALAALIHRDRTGGGAHVHISQAEVVVNQLDTMFVAEAPERPTLPRSTRTPVCMRSTLVLATTNGASSQSAPTMNGVARHLFSASLNWRTTHASGQAGHAWPTVRSWWPQCRPGPAPVPRCKRPARCRRPELRPARCIARRISSRIPS